MELLKGVAMLLWIPFYLLQIGFWAPVVREHCVDLDASQAAQAVDVDSNWKPILWPPLAFAALDPAGGCVRNNLAREGLAKAGVWKLPEPEEQIRDHLESQVRVGEPSEPADQ